MLINQYKTNVMYQIVKSEVIFFSRYALYYLKNGFRHRTILFYPEYPHRETELYKMLTHMEYNVINNPNQKFDIAIHWEDTTVRKDNPLLNKLSKDYPVLNIKCQDISKTRVEEIFQKVFGYGSFVDPTTHQGICVQKNIRNAAHDGKIIECPIAKPEPGYIYQKLLKKMHDETSVVDYRIAIIGNSIPVVVNRYKPLESRFDKTLRAELKSPEEVFTKEELHKIKVFAKEFGIQYGELDIIRNEEDGRIYILDVNNTPWSPPSTVPFDKQERQTMLQKSADAFRDNFLTNPKLN